VEVDNDKVVGYEEKLIWLWADIDLKPSPQVAALVREVDDLVGEEHAKVIGEAKADQNVNYYPGENIFVESPLGNWITDVMRWKTGAQIGFHNTGAIRANIKAGPITKSNIFDVAPFHNTLVVFKLTGQQLKDALEADVERGWDRIQVSGMKYKYHPKEIRPYGERVEYIEIKGEVLVKKGKVFWPGKVYTIVSNNYLVGHAKEKYLGFHVTAPNDTGIILDNILMEWLNKHKVLNYKIEERIVEIK
jgi:2',3'-cyclic-nucleotide 2'-phosphodiesterase (5'-nucleotidase family)